MADTPEPQPATTIPPAIRVKVTWDEEYGQPKVESTHRIPTTALILQQLTTQQQKLIPSRYRRSTYYSIYDIIRATRESIPLQVWSDAIGAATIKGIGCTAAAAETILGNLTDEGAYMAMGGSVFKMVPVQHAPMQKALAALKRHATEKAKGQAESIVAAAKQESAAIQANATQAALTINANARKVKQEAERILAEARINNPPPAILSNSGFPVRKVANQWQVGFTVDIALRSFIYRHEHYTDVDTDAGTQLLEKTWAARPLQAAVPTLCWVPVTPEGSYTVTAIGVDMSCSQLPHVQRGKGCMGISDAPSRLVTSDDMLRLMDGFTRTMSGVQLNSLYVDPKYWLPAFGKFMPPDLLEIMRDEGNWGSRLQRLVVDEFNNRQLAAVDRNAESAETWTVPR